MKVLIVFSLLLIFSFATANKIYKDCNDCDSYRVGIVGGGFSGVTASYLFTLIERLNKETNSGLRVINISDVILFESQSELGGDAKSKVSNYIDPAAAVQVRKLYNYNGPYYYDIGPQRIPQLTTRLQRSLAIDVYSLQEFTPYITNEYTRGKVVQCPIPNFFDYSPENPYGMPSTCTDSFPFMGDNSVPWQYDNYIGPGYNYTTLQDWAYMQGPVLSAFFYTLDYGPNPITCANSSASCEECGDCFSTTSLGFLNLKAALLAKLGTELTAAVIQDYGGFYADFEQGLFNATIWATDFWPREFDTNLMYGYTVGGMQRGYVYKLAQPILQQGTVLVNTLITDISTAETEDGDVGIVVTTEDCEKYYVDFLIYAGQPELIFNGTVSGDIAKKIRSSPIFQSVYSVPVETVDVVLNTTYLKGLVPQNVITNTTFTKEWATLKGNGPDIISSRWEYRHTPYGISTNSFRPIVADFYSLDALKDVKTAYENGNTQVKQQLWNAIRVDQAYINEIPIETIPTTFKSLNINRLETGYYYVWANTTTSAEQLVEFARAPLGDDVPICLAHEAWNPRYLGWAEAGMRAAQRCLDRLIPGSSDLIECWLTTTFPECPDDSCFSDPINDILGTETIIPSKYCSERWYTNDYVQTPGCIRRVKLSPTTCRALAKEVKSKKGMKVNDLKYKAMKKQ